MMRRMDTCEHAHIYMCTANFGMCTIIHCWCTVDASLTHCLSTIDPSLIHRWFIVDPTLIHRWSMVDSWLIHRWSIVDPSLIHRWPVPIVLGSGNSWKASILDGNTSRILELLHNVNNTTHYVKLGKKRRESSKRYYYIISPSDHESNHHHPNVKFDVFIQFHSCSHVLYSAKSGTFFWHVTRYKLDVILFYY